ncbi:MAG: 6-phosphofructokinase [Myxococcales bacterium]|nr:6-phosphofructokinase [Myxococcales bacterium]
MGSPHTPRPFRRVCLLTAGGDAPGLNAVIRAFVKRADALGIEVLGSEDGFSGLMESPRRVVPLDRASVRGILHRGGSILGCSNKANPFAELVTAADGTEASVDASARVRSNLDALGVDALVLVGGDGTMYMGQRFVEQGVPVIGVPKTIDNDLGVTDLTFGFDTAVSTATWAIDTLHSTAEAHDRVMVLEVMGRDAGWIALESGIAGGGDIILIPEIPYDIDRVVAHIEARAERGTTFSLVIVGEGAYPVGGAPSVLQAGREGHLPRLGGAGERVASLLRERMKHDVRVTVLGHLQRGGSPTAFDRVLGTRFGVHAAELCHRGVRGRLVVLAGTRVTDVSLAEAVSNPKRVDPNGELARTARAIDIELGG